MGIKLNVQEKEIARQFRIEKCGSPSIEGFRDAFSLYLVSKPISVVERSNEKRLVHLLSVTKSNEDIQIKEG